MCPSSILSCVCTVCLNTVIMLGYREGGDYSQGESPSCPHLKKPVHNVCSSQKISLSALMHKQNISLWNRETSR